MSEITALADVERLVWRLSGWQVEQRDVDALLALVEAYAAGQVPAEPRPDPGEAREAVQPLRGEPSVPDAAPVPRVSSPDAQGGVQPFWAEGAYVLTVTRVCKPDGPGAGVKAAQDAPETERTCNKCRLTFAITEFSRDKKSRGGRKAACRLCENVRRRDQRRAQRDSARAARAVRQREA